MKTAEELMIELAAAERYIAKLEEKIKLAKLIGWRETDEGPITLYDVEREKI